MKTLTAVLLAGGESRRMGRDKATLIFEGEPLWSRQLRTLRELRPEAILVSARTRPSWCPPVIESVLDAPPSRGPLSGLAAALGKSRTTHLLALAVDLPEMTAVHLELLWSLVHPGTGVVPQNGGFFEPLCAVYPVGAGAEANRALAEGDVSMQSFIRRLAGKKQLSFYEVPHSRHVIYRNLNAPAD